ncbi:uncharacterized protein LOC125719202 [Brienomyrus brachyistius]|uniref:uncharacterized protein LOC125719202 n=1 Tax=Brienomyrus brachyistius TaxID=42636 RepID=UPI0020B38AB5|nr:uncharacterized protein LOC125719202 [Brienomyrus brachyistius]
MMKGFSLWCSLPLLLHAAVTADPADSQSTSPPAASTLKTEGTILTTNIITTLQLKSNSSAEGTPSSAMPTTLTSSTDMGPTSTGTPSTPSVMQNPTDRATTSCTTGPSTKTQAALGGGTCILIPSSLLLGLLLCILLTNMKHLG